MKKDIKRIDIESETEELSLVTMLVKSGMCNNSSEVRNALSGNSVKVNNEVKNDPKFMIKLDKINNTLLQVGMKNLKW